MLAKAEVAFTIATPTQNKRRRCFYEAFCLYAGVGQISFIFLILPIFHSIKVKYVFYMLIIL